MQRLEFLNDLLVCLSEYKLLNLVNQLSDKSLIYLNIMLLK